MPNQYTGPLPVKERFWSKVDRTGGPDACWLWTGSCFDSGYGQFSQTRSINRRAHRVAYELAIGPIPNGLNVLHRCDVRRCCNPAHFFLGTHLDNVADRDAKGRQARGNQSGRRQHPERFPHGARHPNAKLTQEQANAIRIAFASGRHSKKSLAARFGVSRASVLNVVRGKTYRT